MARFRQRGIRLDPLFGYFSFGSSSFSNDHHFPSVSFYSSIKMAAPSNCSFLLCYLCNSKERADSSLTLLSSPNFKLYFYSSVRYRDFLQFFFVLVFTTPCQVFPSNTFFQDKEQYFSAQRVNHRSFPFFSLSIFSPLILPLSFFRFFFHPLSIWQPTSFSYTRPSLI